MINFIKKYSLAINITFTFLLAGMFLLVFFKEQVTNWAPVLPDKAMSLATIVYTWATLELVLVTVTSVFNTNEQAEKARLSAIEDKKTERKERLRNEILKWSIDVANFALQYRTEALRALIDISSREYLDQQLIFLFSTVEPFRVKSVYMSEVASALDEPIKAGVNEVIDALKTQIKALHEYSAGNVQELELMTGIVATNNGNIHGKATDLIKLIAHSDVIDL